MKFTTYFTRLFFIIATVSFSLTSFSQSCPSGLISYWKMDETGGITFTDEQSGHNATRTAELTYHSGIVGNSQYFSFWDREKAEIQNSSDFSFPANSGFTIVYWLRFTETQYGLNGGQDHIVISKGDWNSGGPSTAFWASGVNGSGKVNFMLADQTGTKIDLEGDGHYNDGQWHQVTCIHTADNHTYLYVDGEMTDNTTYGYTQGFSNSSPIEIACLYQHGNPEYYFMGDVDEIGIFNRAISKDEIDQIISSGLSGLGICNTGQSSTSPNITSNPVTTGSINAAYTYAVHASGTQSGMTYSLVTNPEGMTINSTTGVISWTPSSQGVFAVEVKADNGIDPFDTQSFNITVTGLSPTITSIPVTQAFVNSPYAYAVHASGTQEGMTYSLTTKPAGMTINPSTGLITWTPDANGDYLVEVKADNGINPYATQSFTITIAEPTNCPDGIITLHRLDESAGPVYADFYGGHDATASVSPTATSGIINSAQEFTASTKLDIPDNGTEFDWLTGRSFSFECWVKTSITGSMAAIARNRTDYVAARWLVGTNTSGKATFELRDNGGPNVVISGTSNIADNEWHHIIAVRDGNSDMNRLYVDGIQEASSAVLYGHTFKADDPLVATIGYIKGAADELHFIGAIDEVAIFDRAVSPAEVTLFYNGGSPAGHCNSGNIPPEFTTVPITSANEDSPYTYTAIVNDPDASGTLTMTAIVKPSWLNFTWSAATKSGVLSGTPTNSNVGDDDVTLRVSDGDISVDQSFRITIHNTNDAPSVTSTPATSISEGSLYVYTLMVSDDDAGDLMNIYANTLPSWLSLSWTNGARTATISGTPGHSDVGSNSVDISISDGAVTIHDSFVISVIEAAQAPIITGQNSLSMNEDGSITIVKSDLTITDADNSIDQISIIVLAGDNYSFNGNTVTPSANFNGQLLVNVKAYDNSEESLPYPVIVTVNPVNDAPFVTSNPDLHGTVGLLYAYIFAAEDADQDEMILSVVAKPEWLDFSASTGLLSGVPGAGDIGEHQVLLQVSDGIVTIDHLFTITVSMETGVTEIQKGHFVMYPVPANDVLHIQFNQLSEETQVEILTTSGTVVTSKSFPANTDNAELTVSNLGSGVYLCRVINSSMNRIERFTIVR
jgi:large repetitive protein